MDRRTVKPVIAAVNGYCVGAALLVLGLHTDLRIAGESAKFGMPEAKIGLGGGGDVACRLVKQIPRTAMMWMVETASFLDAQAALDCFLVNEVVPDEQVMDRARAVAEMVAAVSPVALRAEKTAIINLEDVQFDQAVVLAGSLAALTELSEDAREGLAAAREGREPIFPGR
jgi:enoyl-CoA hydratase/carnithine racemase